MVTGTKAERILTGFLALYNIDASVVIEEANNRMQCWKLSVTRDGQVIGTVFVDYMYGSVLSRSTPFSEMKRKCKND